MKQQMSRYIHLRRCFAWVLTLSMALHAGVWWGFAAESIPEERTGTEPAPPFRRGYIIREQSYPQQTGNPDANILADPDCADEAFWQAEAEGYGVIAQVVNDKGYTGNSSLRITGSGGSYIKWFDVKADTTYQLTFTGMADPDVLTDIHFELISEDGVPFGYNTDSHSYFFDVIGIIAQDGDWHRRTITFATQECTRIGLKMTGTKGTVWIDDVQVYLAKQEISEEDRSAASITVVNTSMHICADEDNLIATLNTDQGEGIFSAIHGYDRFIRFGDFEGENMLYYKGEGKQKYYYTLPLEVEEGKTYVFSYYIRVTEEGRIRFGLLDGIFQKTTIGKMRERSKVGDWVLYTHTFTAGSAGTVYFSIYNDTGAALFTKFRLFEKERGMPETDEDRPGYTEMPPVTSEPGYTTEPYVVTEEPGTVTGTSGGESAGVPAFLPVVLGGAFAAAVGVAIAYVVRRKRMIG